MTVALVNASASLYSVDASNGSGSYLVDLRNKSCTCLDFKHRRATRTLGDPERSCKHQRQAELAAPFLKAEAKAKGLSDEALAKCLSVHANNPVVGGALRVERLRRKQQAAQDDALKALFA